jgi:thymidylate synthase
MKQYLDLVRHVLHEGTRKENRTGVDTISTFGYYYEVDLRNGFPLLTTKAVSWKNIVIEMLWFLSGQTNIDILKRHGCKFWDAWADESGKVPSAYGNFWRHFPIHGKDVTLASEGSEPIGEFNDQIRWVLEELKRNPMSRRMVVSAWAPGNAQTSKLPPCHCLFMFNVQNDPWVKFNSMKNGDTEYGDKQRLCLHLTQRSCDVALGVPYNIASYALLLSLFSQFSGIEPGIFGHTLVDAHVYTMKPDGSKAEFDHIPGLMQQIAREPKPLPRLVIDPTLRDLQDIEALMDPKLTTDEVMSHFVLEGYDPYPAISFKVAV